MNIVGAITLIAAAAGVGLAVWAASTAFEPPPVLVPEEPSVNPFQSGVAALGKVEPSAREQPIGAPTALVMNVLVDVGDRVKAGPAAVRAGCAAAAGGPGAGPGGGCGGRRDDPALVLAAAGGGCSSAGGGGGAGEGDRRWTARRSWG